MSVAITGNTHQMQTCNHEEADTRILIYIQDALDNGSTTCLVCTVDSDVAAIFVGKFHSLLEQCPSAEVWLAFGTGKWFKNININAIII